MSIELRLHIDLERKDNSFINWNKSEDLVKRRNITSLVQSAIFIKYNVMLMWGIIKLIYYSLPQ